MLGKGTDLKPVKAPSELGVLPDVDNCMADIFDEIDEDLKRDQMQLLWARYGRIVIAAVAAIVLLVALRQGYTVGKVVRPKLQPAPFSKH